MTNATLNDLTTALNTVKFVHTEMCEDREYFCERCSFKINGICIIGDTETGLNIIIRQYREQQKKPHQTKEVTK